MVEFYVIMVQRGIKVIEEIPVKYREQVKIILEALMTKYTTEEEIDVTTSIETPNTSPIDTTTFTLDKSVEEVNEQVEERLTYDIAYKITTSYGLTLSQTINYIAVKRNSRFNVATINNDLTAITVKNVDTFTINNKEDLINIIELYLMEG